MQPVERPMPDPSDLTSAGPAAALRVRPLPAEYRGAAPTIAGLTGRWATDAQYAAKLARRANAILATSVAKAAA